MLFPFVWGLFCIFQKVFDLIFFDKFRTFFLDAQAATPTTKVCMFVVAAAAAAVVVIICCLSWSWVQGGSDGAPDGTVQGKRKS